MPLPNVKWSWHFPHTAKMFDAKGRLPVPSAIIGRHPSAVARASIYDMQISGQPWFL